MNLLFARAKIVGVADAWRKQYPVAQYPDDDPKGKIRRALDAIDPAAMTPDQVAQIIGNKSWSHISCDECGQYGERGVSLGEYDAKTYCTSCLRAASALASAVLP